MEFIKLLIIIILIILIIYFYKKRNVKEHMSEGIYNLLLSNEKLLQNLNNFTTIKMEEIINSESTNINEDVFNYKLCSNNKCVSDSFIRDISNNKITFDISANTVSPLPKINNYDIENYFTSFNNLINVNYMYSPLSNNYIYYDLSNNQISNIISIDNNSRKTDFLTRSPKSIFTDGTTQPTYLNSYFIDFNKSIYDVFTNISSRILDSSGVQITVPNNYNTVWIKVLNSTNFDASFNKITSFMVKSSSGKYLGTYSNNAIKYVGLQPNGLIYSKLPYTWIPIYVGNNKNIVLNGDLILTNNDLTKVINNSYNTSAYTTTVPDKNCNQTAYNIPTITLQNCIKSFTLGNVVSRDISGYMNVTTTNKFLNSFTGIAFSNNPYNHTKLSGYSLINPHSVKIKNTTRFDNSGSIVPEKLLGAQMYLVDLSNNPIVTQNTLNINTNGFAVFIRPAPSTSAFAHSINKNRALFNIPIIVTNNPKILYFWFHDTIPENLLTFQLYYETNYETNNDVIYMNNRFPISSLTNTNLYPIEYFNIKNIYGCILTNEDINNYFSQNNSIKTLDNNFGFLGLSLNLDKMVGLNQLVGYPNQKREIGIYEIGMCDYYENISF